MRTKRCPKPRAAADVGPNWWDEVEEVLEVMRPLELSGGIPALNNEFRRSKGKRRSAEAE